MSRAYRLKRGEPVPEWRKRTKGLWYHCSILEETWKPVMSALADEAHELLDRLGDDHHLALLPEWGAEPTAFVRRIGALV